jgi:hypothetical protein
MSVTAEAPATAPDSELFSERLKAATWSDHQSAEDHGFTRDLMSGTLPLAGYTAMVAQHYFAYVALEKVGRSLIGDPLAGRFHYPELERVPALVADLEHLLGADWRARVMFVAETLWRHYLRHPWVLDLATHRPVLGPNTVAAYEFALSAVDGLGLTEIEMDMTVTMLANYVHGAVRDAARRQMVDEATGMSDDEWWRRIEPFLGTLDYSPYPVSSRVGPVAGETYGAGDPQRAFRFGLDRLLDGLALFIEGKRR